MDIKDVSGLGQALTKLIEVIAQGVGSVSKAHLIRRNAKAQAEAIKLLSDAVHDAQSRVGIRDGEIVVFPPDNPDTSELKALSERASARRQFQDVREQSNIEQITSYAAEELKHEEVVSDEPVDPDWVATFFDSSKTVTTEEMQFIWGKILAGEVKQPGSFSLRTLGILRNLSQSEAETFRKIANFAIGPVDEMCFIVFPANGKYLSESFDIHFLDLLLLQELSLITFEDVMLTMSGDEKFIVYGNTAVTLDFPENAAEVTFEVKKFTIPGKELLSLVEPEMNLEYLTMFAEPFRKQDVVVKYGPIIKKEKDDFAIGELKVL